MKKIGLILVSAGVLLLILAIGGKFVGKPGIVLGFKVMNIILLANTVLLLALVAKTFEKK
jgi:hypothetical protein